MHGQIRNYNRLECALREKFWEKLKLGKGVVAKSSIKEFYAPEEIEGNPSRHPT